MRSDYKNFKLTPRPARIKLNRKWLASVATACAAYYFWPANNPVIQENTIELPDQAQMAEFDLEETEIAPVLHQASTDVEQHQVTVARGDSISRILTRFGLSEDVLFRDLNKRDRRKLSNITPGQVIDIVKEDNALKSIHISKGPNKQLVLARKDNGHFKLEESTLDLDKEIVFASGVIEDSLFLSGRKAGIDDGIIMKMADLFAWDIDFSMDLRPNDTFRVIYEKLSYNGESKGNGNIIAAEFVNRGNKRQVIRFVEPNGAVEYFTPEGNNVKKAFLRSPVKFTRISSHFNLRRKHPILHKIRAHRGVDYAAPEGTPIKASGDGKVNFVGVKGGYGNAVELQHGGRYTTLYAHMSRFAKGIKPGTRVKQGQVIGYVGKTGLATAPHLHYEFRVDGVHRNPVTVKLPTADPIAKAYRNDFDSHAKQTLSMLEQMDSSRLASNG